MSHQQTGATGLSQLIRGHSWVDSWFRIQACLSLLASFKVWNKEVYLGCQPQIFSLCGWGGVSGISITHVETLCFLIPPGDPGTDCGES